MFDVGFWEILLILVLALVVIGPERLPGAARQAGFFVGKARRYIEGVRTEVESELDVNEFKRMLHNQEVQITELQEKLQSGVNDMTSKVSSNDILTDTPSHSFYDDKDDDTSDDKKEDMDLDWMHDHFDKIEKSAAEEQSSQDETDAPKGTSKDTPKDTPVDK